MRLSLSAICVVYVHQFTLAAHVPDGAGVGLLSAIRRLHTGCPVVLLKQTLLHSICYCHSHVYASPSERRDSTRHCHSHVYTGPPEHCERQKAPNKSISGRAHQLSDRIPIADRPYDGSAHSAGFPDVLNSPVEAQSGSSVSNPSPSPPTDICFADDRCSVSPLPAAQRDGACDPALNGAALSDTSGAPAIILPGATDPQTYAASGSVWGASDGGESAAEAARTGVVRTSHCDPGSGHRGWDLWHIGRGAGADYIAAADFPSQAETRSQALAERRSAIRNASALFSVPSSDNNAEEHELEKYSGAGRAGDERELAELDADRSVVGSQARMRPLRSS